ncbi:MAG TPA: hypothetical protein VFR23_06790 [Jiangellaceae bacterium]|nr:hypothetical protein [Jiangellaceae bacterium]
MTIYADHPYRRSRQILADLLGVMWCVIALLVARGIYSLVELLGRPGTALKDAGTGMSGNLLDASDRLQDVPLVGDSVASPFDSAAGAAGRLADAGEAIEDTARLTAIAVALVFLAFALGFAAMVWVLPRLLWVRRANEARRIRATEGGIELLAVRALARRRLPQLAALGEDIVPAWRRGEPAALRSLAALELRRLGLAPPPAPATAVARPG